ncbi:hypothetical protein [Stenotrophomonas sp. NPDC077659]|uniref:hypothetical protein n=1 Tax=Stenotrophomonas sp. NPDC077659 TaxID=3390694 RepID=UPI003D053895
MSDLAQDRSVDQGTNVGRFLANRGVIVVKENRPAGRCKGEHGDSIAAETLILNVIKGAKKDTSYGVRLERIDQDGDTDSAVFLDHDELPELINAIDFIAHTAVELSGQDRDYTEVTYSTKDGATFGFYHSDQEQLAFLKLSDHRSSTFLPVNRLGVLKQMLQEARAHLQSCGASDD